jgi:hypothetical protein
VFLSFKPHCTGSSSGLHAFQINLVAKRKRLFLWFNKLAVQETHLDPTANDHRKRWNSPLASAAAAEAATSQHHAEVLPTCKRTSWDGVESRQKDGLLGDRDSSGSRAHIEWDDAGYLEDEDSDDDDIRLDPDLPALDVSQLCEELEAKCLISQSRGGAGGPLPTRSAGLGCCPGGPLPTRSAGLGCCPGGPLPTRSAGLGCCPGSPHRARSYSETAKAGLLNTVNRNGRTCFSSGLQKK